MPRPKPTDAQIERFKFRANIARRRKEKAERERAEASSAIVRMYVEARNAGIPIAVCEEALGVKNQYVHKVTKGE